MSKAEFQKLHDEIRALKTSGKHDEFAKKFAAKGAVFLGPLHDPMGADGKLPQGEKMAMLAKAEINVSIDEVTQLGDIVIDRCTINAKLPQGERTGWSLTVWVKEDGTWKIRNSCVTFKVPTQ